MPHIWPSVDGAPTLPANGEATDLGRRSARSTPHAATSRRLWTSAESSLRAKLGGDQISVKMGDFADVGVPDTYGLIYVVYSTLFNLLTQDDQIRCFENVADRLRVDGLFVMEAFDPAFLYRLRDDQYVDAEAVGVADVRLDVGRHDPVAQPLDETHVVLSHGGVRLIPAVTRYAWSSELDLMARIAGLRLKERWAGWNREPSTPTSRAHISVDGR